MLTVLAVAAVMPWRWWLSLTWLASGPRLDLNHAPCVLYGVKYIDLVSLAPFSAVLLLWCHSA